MNDSTATPVSRRVVLQAAGAGTLLAMLTGRSTFASQGTTPAGTAAPGAAGAAGTPITADVFKVGFPSSMTNLYPGKEAGIVNYYAVSLVGEGLLAPDPTGKLVPALAESFEQTSDTTYVFTLRSKATFSDGSAVTPADVVASVTAAKDEAISPNTAYAWGNLASVEATGDNQVTFTLSSPDVAFEWVATAANALWVMPKSFIEAHTADLGTPAAMIIGTGPYKVTSFSPDSHVEFEAVDTWWGGPVTVAKVRIDFISDESTRLLARQSGDIDLAINISLDQVAEWDEAGDTAVLITPNRSYVGIDFNTTLAPFDDIHVRRAIAFACDRAGFVANLLGGHGEPATALTTPQQIEAAVGADQARAMLSTVLDLPFDLEAAKAELSQSKTPTGFTTKVGVSNSAPQVSQMFQSLKQTLEPLGIVIEIQEMPVEQWYDTIGSDEWGLAYMDYTNTTGDPAEMSSWFLGEGNPAKFTNALIDAKMAKAKAEKDPAKRAEMLVEAQSAALAEIPYIPLWWGVAASALRDDYAMAEFSSYAFLAPWTSRITTTS